MYVTGYNPQGAHLPALRDMCVQYKELPHGFQRWWWPKWLFQMLCQ